MPCAKASASSPTTARHTSRCMRCTATSALASPSSAPSAMTASTCASFRRKSLCGCASCCSSSPASRAKGSGRPNNSPRCAPASTGTSPQKLVRALRAFGLADLRADPLSPLPLELALADSTMAPRRARTRAACAGRAADVTSRAGAAARAGRGTAATAPAPRHRLQRTQDAVPADLRKDLSKASAEDIARMLGSKAPVIPPAPDEPEPAVTPAATPPAGSRAYCDERQRRSAHRSEHERHRPLDRRRATPSARTPAQRQARCAAQRIVRSGVVAGRDTHPRLLRGQVPQEGRRGSREPSHLRRAGGADPRGTRFDPVYHCAEAGAPDEQEPARATRSTDTRRNDRERDQES